MPIKDKNQRQEAIKHWEKLEAHDAILNCLHRLLQYLSLQYEPGDMQCFALECDVVSLESAKSGVYIGTDSIKKIFRFFARIGKIAGNVVRAVYVRLYHRDRTGWEDGQTGVAFYRQG